MKTNGRLTLIDETEMEEVTTDGTAITETPLLKEAFNLNDESKIKLITNHFREIMQIMGLDLNDDSLKGTPHRLAKMYVKEIFSGLNPANKPKITRLDNKYQ